MKDIRVLSPARAAGLPLRFSACKRSWHESPFQCGDRVIDKTDSRHIGRISAIFGGLVHRVRWESGFVSDLRRDQIALSS